MARGVLTRARIARALRPALRATADLLLPLACVSCDRLMDAGEPGIVCGRCWVRIGYLPYPQCARCGHPQGAHECRWCTLLPPYVRAVRSVCWVPDGPAGQIVHALKYGGWMRVASAMAERMAHLPWPADVVEERRYIAPVPLAQRRQRERGYNQSALLADALAQRWNAIPANLLARTRPTVSQTQLTPEDRLRNVADAFTVRAGGPSFAGSHVMLVDDVVTTAATLNACAAVLYENGARVISYVTFGRARSAGDR